MKTIEMIENYLEGKLQGKELEEFQKLIESDKSIANDVKLLREINESIFDDDLQNFRQLSKKLIIKEKSPLIKRLAIVSSAAAAILILVFSTISLFQQPNSNNAYSSFYSPYLTDLNTRSTGILTQDLGQGYLLYQKGEYKKAFDIFLKYNSKGQDNITSQFYLGLCAMETGNNSISEQAFQNVVSDGNSPFVIHAKWYLGMLYLKSKETEKARSIFTELANEENGYYAEKSRKILKKF